MPPVWGRSGRSQVRPPRSCLYYDIYLGCRRVTRAIPATRVVIALSAASGGRSTGRASSRRASPSIRASASSRPSSRSTCVDGAFHPLGSAFPEDPHRGQRLARTVPGQGIRPCLRVPPIDSGLSAFVTNRARLSDRGNAIQPSFPACSRSSSGIGSQQPIAAARVTRAATSASNLSSDPRHPDRTSSVSLRPAFLSRSQTSLSRLSSFSGPLPL